MTHTANDLKTARLITTKGWPTAEKIAEAIAAERERCAQVADSMNSTQDIGDRIRHGLGGSGETQL